LEEFCQRLKEDGLQENRGKWIMSMFCRLVNQEETLQAGNEEMLKRRVGEQDSSKYCSYSRGKQ
jgi:hypothetical protein